MTGWQLLAVLAAAAAAGALVGLLVANEVRLRRRAVSAAARTLDFTPAAARGELDLDWSFPAVSQRRETATPRSLRA